MSAATRSERTVHVEHCMGTAFTVDVRDPGPWDDAVHDVVSWLHHVDAVFSTYRADSDISRMRRGELKVADAAPEVSEVLDLCADVQLETDGFFSAMSSGRIDPTGLVKGWAVQRASTILRTYGSDNHAVNGGGDIQLSGESRPGQPWRVGVADPHERGRIVTTVEGRDLAVATSGSAERGQHIIDPFTGRPGGDCASATVIGPSLTRADAYATAAFVMGREAMAWVRTHPGYEVLVIGRDGTSTRSSGWPSPV